METRFSNAGNLVVSDSPDGPWRHPNLSDFDALGIIDIRRAYEMLTVPKVKRTTGGPDPRAAQFLPEMKAVYERIRKYETRDDANIPNRLASLIRWTEYCALHWNEAQQTSYFRRITTAERWYAAWERQTALIDADHHAEDASLDADYDECDRIMEEDITHTLRRPRAALSKRQGYTAGAAGLTP